MHFIGSLVNYCLHTLFYLFFLFLKEQKPDHLIEIKGEVLVVVLFRRLVTWGEGRFYPKTNSKYFDGSWKFSKDEKEINYSVRGSKTSLSSTVSRLSSGWLIVRHCFRNLVLKQSCHPPHGWGTLVPAEEFKDIVMYIP